MNIFSKTSESQSVMGKRITTYNFGSDAYPVVSISFIALNNFGVVAATVEVLKGISDLVQTSPPGEVYKYMNIWVGDTGFATPGNIEDAVISFKVEKSWMSGNGIQDSSISMYRYNDNEWNKLQTRKVRVDDDFVYFEAKTPGFSPFAVTGISQKDSMTASSESSGSESDDNLFTTGLSPETASSEGVPFTGPSSGIMKWLGILFMLLLLVVLGAYAGVKRGILPLDNKRYENVIFKDVLSGEITAKSPASYDFDNDENPIRYIRFSTKDFSGVAEVKVEVLRERSGFVKSDPPGKPYVHMNIWIGSEGLIDSSIISDPSIGFRVDRFWLEKNEFDRSSVVFFRFADDAWHEMPTELVSEDDGYLVFEAQTPGFSSFVISIV